MRFLRTITSHSARHFAEEGKDLDVNGAITGSLLATGVTAGLMTPAGARAVIAGATAAGLAVERLAD